MELMIVNQFKLILNAAELRIVSKALRGTLNDEEKKQALAIQVEIMTERSKQFGQALDEAQKAVKNIETTKVA